MAVLGYSIYGNTVLGINEAAGKLGGVLTTTRTEPLWLSTQKIKLMDATRSRPPDFVTLTKMAGQPQIALTREDGE